MPELTLATFERVHGMVKRILNPSFDTENLAMEVTLESWANGHDEPSWSFIRHRCYDLLRRSQKEKDVMKIPRPRSSDTIVQAEQEVGQLMKVLNAQEKKIIFYRYYLDLPLREISGRIGVDVNKVRESISSALYKMREVGQE